MFFNRYVQYISSICGIYQQRITKLKELDREARREGERRKEKKNKDHVAQIQLQVDCPLIF